jgi:hypothetical protein
MPLLLTLRHIIIAITLLLMTLLMPFITLLPLIIDYWHIALADYIDIIITPLLITISLMIFSLLLISLLITIDWLFSSIIIRYIDTPLLPLRWWHWLRYWLRHWHYCTLRHWYCRHYWHFRYWHFAAIIIADTYYFHYSFSFIFIDYYWFHYYFHYTISHFIIFDISLILPLFWLLRHWHAWYWLIHYCHYWYWWWWLLIHYWRHYYWLLTLRHISLMPYWYWWWHYYWYWWHYIDIDIAID